MNSLGNCYHYRRFLRQKLPDPLHEIVQIKSQLRKINQVRSRTVFSLCKGSRSGKPSCVSSHNLHDGHQSFAVLKAKTVADNLFYRCSNIFRRTSVSRCMVCQCQIIINGLRASDKTGRISHHNRIVGKLFDRIHRVIAPDIDKRLNIQLIQKLKNLLIHFPVLMDLRQFITARPQVCRRSPL